MALKLPWRRRRPRLRVKLRTADPTATGGYLYELSPESYAGPWQLEPGTILEVVRAPARGLS